MSSLTIKKPDEENNSQRAPVSPEGLEEKFLARNEACNRILWSVAAAFFDYLGIIVDLKASINSYA